MSSVFSSQDQFCPFWGQFCGFAYIIRLGDHFCGRTGALANQEIGPKLTLKFVSEPHILPPEVKK